MDPTTVAALNLVKDLGVAGLCLVVWFQLRDNNRIQRGMARDISRLLHERGLPDDSGDTSPPETVPVELSARMRRTPVRGVPIRRPKTRGEEP